MWCVGRGGAELRTWVVVCCNERFTYNLHTSHNKPLQDAFQLAGEPYCRHQLLRFGDGAPVILAVGSGLALPGYTLIVDERGAADLYAALVNKVREGTCGGSSCLVGCGKQARIAHLSLGH